MDSIFWLILALWLSYLSIGRMTLFRIDRNGVHAEFRRLGWRAERWLDAALRRKLEGRPNGAEERSRRLLEEHPRRRRRRH